MPEPVRLLPGPEAADSPELADDVLVPVWAWDAWLRVVDDRIAGRPTPLSIVRAALDVDEPSWNLWWDRDHPRGVLTHRAALVDRTLVAFCGYSTPARPELHAWEMGDRAIRDSLRTYCSVCLRADPWLKTA